MGYAKRCKTKKWYLGLLPYYKNLHTEYLASYTNTPQLIGYQHFTQCKMLQIPPTRNLHNSHVATRTSTGGRCHGIGEQKGLLLRQIVLRPYAVLSTAYVQTDCVTGGEVCKMYAGVCKIL